MKEIKRIVLTGGPCAGKTTALKRIRQHFGELGYKVFIVPEVPTMVTESGWNYLTHNQDFYYEGEKMILEMQLALEDRVMHLAEIYHKPCFVVCDRGTMDISAYIAPEMWKELTASCGTSTEALRDSHRYDAVIHLVSAAAGAEEYYTTANNENRYEKADEEGLNIARTLDQKTYDAWTGHRHRTVIDSNANFDEKMALVIKEIASIVKVH